MDTTIIMNRTRGEVADLIDTVWQSIPDDIVTNSWTSGDFNYFEDEELDEAEGVV